MLTTVALLTHGPVPEVDRAYAWHAGNLKRTRQWRLVRVSDQDLAGSTIQPYWYQVQARTVTLRASHLETSPWTRWGSSYDDATQALRVLTTYLCGPA